VKHTFVIARRELLAAAVSPVTWLTLLVAWSLASVLAYFYVLPKSEGEVSMFVWGMASFWIFLQILICPILSMRLLSEEKRTGTLEALMTAPVSDHEVVIGKFLAANVIHAVAAAIVPLATLPFVLHGKSADLGQLTGAYVTAVGIGALFLGAGVFASSLTSSQVLAAFVTILIEAALVFGPSLTTRYLPPESPFRQAFVRGDLFEHVQYGSLGIVDLNYVAYHVVMAALFLLFAVRSLEVRKWR
jgi:ABC-2 type transport system permease protein